MQCSRACHENFGTANNGTLWLRQRRGYDTETKPPEDAEGPIWEMMLKCEVVRVAAEIKNEGPRNRQFSQFVEESDMQFPGLLDTGTGTEWRCRPKRR